MCCSIALSSDYFRRVAPWLTRSKFALMSHGWFDSLKRKRQILKRNWEKTRKANCRFEGNCRRCHNVAFCRGSYHTHVGSSAFFFCNNSDSKYVFDITMTCDWSSECIHVTLTPQLHLQIATALILAPYEVFSNIMAEFMSGIFCLYFWMVGWSQIMNWQHSDVCQMTSLRGSVKAALYVPTNPFLFVVAFIYTVCNNIRTVPLAWPGEHKEGICILCTNLNFWNVLSLT